MAMTAKMPSEIWHRVVWYKSTNVMAEPAVSIVKVSLINTGFFSVTTQLYYPNKSATCFGHY